MNLDVDDDDGSDSAGSDEPKQLAAARNWGRFLAKYLRLLAQRARDAEAEE
jgi:hypothetical protein